MNGQLELDLGAQSNESNKYKRISDLDMYQKVAKSTAIYPREQAIIYPSLGLTGEAGEVANKVKKIIRDGTNQNIIQEISNEIGDCLWYVAVLADDIGCKLSDIANNNLIKLANRKKTAQSTVLATKDSRTKQEHSCAFLHSP
jgi:NTP pyrophosphatase (non-canonical NTP hydrolase)|tara:strand:- start:132 stop:560 length:429 start_codon:yes stop_codon:yes gene_type:complete